EVSPTAWLVPQVGGHGFTSCFNPPTSGLEWTGYFSPFSIRNSGTPSRVALTDPLTRNIFDFPGSKNAGRATPSACRVPCPIGIAPNDGSTVNSLGVRSGSSG